MPRRDTWKEDIIDLYSDDARSRLSQVREESDSKGRERMNAATAAPSTEHRTNSNRMVNETELKAETRKHNQATLPNSYYHKETPESKREAERRTKREEERRKRERYERRDDHNGRQEVWQEDPTQKTFMFIGTPPPLPPLHPTLQHLQKRSSSSSEFPLPNAHHRGFAEASNGADSVFVNRRSDVVRDAAYYNGFHDLDTSTPPGRYGSRDYFATEPAQRYGSRYYNPGYPNTKPRGDTSRRY